jgi:hypothetical protein
VLAFVFGFIIIGKAAPFDPWPSLEDSANLVIFRRELDHMAFTSFDIATLIPLQRKVFSLAYL